MIQMSAATSKLLADEKMKNLINRLQEYFDARKTEVKSFEEEKSFISEIYELVRVVKSDGDFIFEPSNQLTILQKIGVSNLMESNSLNWINVYVDEKGEIIEFSTPDDEDDELSSRGTYYCYKRIVAGITDILDSEYWGKEFSLECLGDDEDDWVLKSYDFSFDENGVLLNLSENLRSALKQLMLLVNIEYLRLVWTGYRIQNFYPIGTFDSIEDDQKKFLNALVSSDSQSYLRFKLDQIYLQCFELASNFDDDSFLEPAEYCENLLDLYELVCKQDYTLAKLLEEATVKTDEISLLYTYFDYNLGLLSQEVQVGGFVLNFALYTAQIEQLEEPVTLFSEDHIERVFRDLYDYIEEEYTGKVFCFLIDEEGLSFVLGEKSHDIDDNLYTLVQKFMDVACVSSLIITWNVDEIELDYFDEPEEVDDVSIMKHFTFPRGDMPASVLEGGDINVPGPLMFPEMESVTDREWQAYLDPDIFRERYEIKLEGLEEPAEIEDEDFLAWEKFLQDENPHYDIPEFEGEDTKYLFEILKALYSLEDLNLTKEQKESFLNSQLACFRGDYIAYILNIIKRSYRQFMV